MLEEHTLVAECVATFPAPYGRMIVGCTWQRPDGTYYNLYSPQYRAMCEKKGIIDPDQAFSQFIQHRRGDE
jgi:hypothetical protein